MPLHMTSRHSCAGHFEPILIHVVEKGECVGFPCLIPVFLTRKK